MDEQPGANHSGAAVVDRMGSGRLETKVKDLGRREKGAGVRLFSEPPVKASGACRCV